MIKRTNEELIEKAYEAMKFSYAPYSNFHVGAAVLTDNDKIYTGCNIENSSYGATNCAERTAMFKAISEGQRKFVKIAIVSQTHSYTYPCGICRQIMSEFMEPDAIILVADIQSGIKEYTLEQLLPCSFKLEAEE